MRKGISIALLSIGMPGWALAQSSAEPAACASGCKQIELGTPLAVTKEPIRPGTYRIRLLNVIPRKHYAVETELQYVSQEIPPPISTSNTEAVAEVVDKCEVQTTQLLDGVAEAKDESEIYALDKSLEKKLTDCEGNAAGLKKARAQFDGLRTFDLTKTIEVGEDEDLIVKVSRLKDGKVEKDLGTYSFLAPRTKPGQWLVYYGFNYIQSDDERFFAKETGATPASYTITPFADRSKWAFSPSLYFMWIKDKNTGGPLDILSWNKGDIFGGVSAGVGFDFDKPTAFLGYGVGWGYNVMVTAGVAMRNVKRLNGRYSSGDTVLENLSEDQIHESTYKPGVFLGVAIRFGENPFGSKKSSTPATPATPPKG